MLYNKTIICGLIFRTETVAFRIVKQISNKPNYDLTLLKKYKHFTFL